MMPNNMIKFAIFSDIHGNIFALEAALADAQQQGAHHYLFIGDYSARLPWANQVANRIRQVENRLVIAGNGEGYLRHPLPAGLKQLAPICHGASDLSPDNLAHWQQLPDQLTVTFQGLDIHLHHHMGLFFRKPIIPCFHSHRFEGLGISSSEYLTLGKEAILNRPDALADVMAMAPGVYLFGHNHLQFHMAHEGRLFINPGSCGYSCDMDPRAAYTMLSYDPTVGEQPQITPRRVDYDLETAGAALERSAFAEAYPDWLPILREGLMTGRDCFGQFIMHLRECAGPDGDFPVSNADFDRGYMAWQKKFSFT